jgi:hypothetical protein
VWPSAWATDRCQPVASCPAIRGQANSILITTLIAFANVIDIRLKLKSPRRVRGCRSDGPIRSPSSKREVERHGLGTSQERAREAAAHLVQSGDARTGTVLREHRVRPGSLKGDVDLPAVMKAKGGVPVNDAQ